MDANGVSRPATFAFQGVLEDAGADHGTRFSVTNAVVVRVD